MFGYVKTDLPNMYVKDTVLYKASYCGLCKSIGCVCGQRGRFALNYDLTFLSILAHNILDVDMVVEKKRCIAHWITKRPVAKVDDLTKKIASLNLILVYYKVRDDIIDEKKGIASKVFFNKAFKKARKAEPIFDKIVNKYYGELLEYEKANVNSIDMVSDPFGCMMQEIFKHVLQDKSDENTSTLAYSLGKWIYLIDALDDFDKDLKKKSFNVFINAYPNAKNKCQLLQENGVEITQIFGSMLNDIRQACEKIQYNFNHDLIDNILKKGLFEQTKKVMECKKCKKTTKS